MEKGLIDLSLQPEYSAAVSVGTFSCFITPMVTGLKGGHLLLRRNEAL
jgi:hypothetical protein